MISHYALYYAEANIVCAIFIGLMLTHDLFKVSRQEKQMLFDYALTAHIAYFISDSCWAAVLGGVLPRARWLVLTVNLTNLIFLASIGFFWFFFALESVGMPLWRNRKKDKRMNLIRLPLVGAIAILLIGFLVAPDFWVSPAGELSIAYYPLLIIPPVLYILASFLCALRQARKQENAANRRYFILVGVYPLSMLVFAAAQFRFSYLPVFCFGLTGMLLFFYIQTMEDRISLDPMTGLNNRGQLLRYVSQPANLHREGLRCYVVMVDADAFKRINDTYGHAEGDHAIHLIAEALKGAAGTMAVPPFLGRYGGDEFILVAHAAGEEEMDALADEVRSRLTAVCQKHQTPYALSVSIGYAELVPEGDSFQDCMKRADRKLYLNKNRRTGDPS